MGICSEYQPDKAENSKQSAFQFDFKNQKILTPTVQVRLRSKLWQLLMCLLKTQGEMVCRNLLIEKVWAGNFYTGPTALNHSICHLRRIFNRLEINLQIVTYPKQGYQLVGYQEFAGIIENRK